jgi:sulfite exporter TauE/SafE
VDLFAVLLTGLFAGGLSCATVQGGLLTGLITRQCAAGGDGPLPWRARLADDLAPVGGFLAGKLVSHAVLGGLLGAVGGAVSLSLDARIGLQLGAGAVVIVFGLARLGVPGFRRIVVEPPASWQRVVRDRARSRAALAPAVLGLVTVLIPCGVTLSVEALALSSGSVLAGAATMAVFVLGTGPLFAMLGYLARAWRGRFAVLTGLVVLGMGLVTVNGGLELAGSPVTAGRIVRSVFGGSPADTGTVSVKGGQQLAVITARNSSYRPENIQVRSGIPTTLVVRSTGLTGCIRTFVIASRDLQQVLPASGETRIPLGILRPGTIRYACAMGMYTGTITVAG